MNTSTVDIFKLVPCSDKLEDSLFRGIGMPFYTSIDTAEVIPLLCISLYRAAGMWVINVTTANHVELAIKDFKDSSYTEEYMALMNAMSVFNNIHKIETLLQLKNIGFTV